MNPQPVALGILRRGDRIFLQRRSLEALHYPGRWEFPGGKLEAGETPDMALRRELWEELRWTPERWKVLPVVRTDRVVLHPFLCEGERHPSTSLAWGWFTWAEARRLPMPAPNARILANLPDTMKNSMAQELS